MAQVDVVFFDVGGVVLTNGWDTACRRRTCVAFGLDFEEFEDRHEFVADAFETGRIGLAIYLEQTVFHRPRDFSPDEFAEAMRSASSALPGGLDLVRGVATQVPVATLNNESRALNEHRIESFGLGELFTAFFSSCYVGIKKPDDGIYRLALDVMAVAPERSAFVDDRPLNLEGATRVGMRTILHRDAATTRSELAELGL